MNNRNSGWWIWLVILLGVGFSGTIFPLLLIIGIVLAVTFAAVESSKKQDARQTSYTRTSGYRRTTTGRYSSADIARINVYLRKWFRTRSEYVLDDTVTLRLHGDRYASMASLDIYRNGSYVSSMNTFERNYPDSYYQIVDELRRRCNEPVEDEIIDVEVTPTPQKKEEPVKKEEPKEAEKGSQYYLEMITQLNDDIPDSEITNGLYETTALLKQIHALEERFPNSKSKLTKLYEYYLPILINILQRYVGLQHASADDSYEDNRQKLSRTVVLVNDAMRKIISSMTDQDFINLSADMSTLEALLQKDGLTEEGQLRSGGDE